MVNKAPASRDNDTALVLHTTRRCGLYVAVVEVRCSNFGTTSPRPFVRDILAEIRIVQETDPGAVLLTPSSSKACVRFAVDLAAPPKPKSCGKYKTECLQKPTEFTKPEQDEQQADSQCRQQQQFLGKQNVSIFTSASGRRLKRKRETWSTKRRYHFCSLYWWGVLNSAQRLELGYLPFLLEFTLLLFRSRSTERDRLANRCTSRQRLQDFSISTRPAHSDRSGKVDLDLYTLPPTRDLRPTCDWPKPTCTSTAPSSQSSPILRSSR